MESDHPGPESGDHGQSHRRHRPGARASGDIIIGHANGNGHGTGQAMPELIAKLRERGYTLSRSANCWPPAGR